VRRWVAPALLATALGGAGLMVVGQGQSDAPPRIPAAGAEAFVRIDRTVIGGPIQPGFVGLSMEYSAVPSYAGTAPRAPNPVFGQLIRDLAPGQSPVLRIGGNSTDHTWWPVAHVPRPPGVSYRLSQQWLADTRALAHRLDARLILGVDLEANDSALAAAEAHMLISGIGRRYVKALEIGNEPELYWKFPWYHTHSGRPVAGRRRSYSFAAFTRQFSQTRALLGTVPLAGPAVGAYDWLNHLRRFLTAEPTLGLVTFHRYPLNRCFTGPGSPLYPSVSSLLSPLASRGLAQGIGPYAAIAHSDRVAFRVDEMNSVACGGKAGVSNTFAAALWALDALFAMARAGADGVNFHTFPSARYALFTFQHGPGGWTGTVRPEYYGLLMFVRAAPPSSRLLRVSATGSDAVRAWATQSADGRIRLVLINADVTHGHLVSILRPSRATAASVERLQAPSARATAGVTLAGQSIDVDTRTGALRGAVRSDPTTARGDRYELMLPPASAALVTITVDR